MKKPFDLNLIQIKRFLILPLFYLLSRLKLELSIKPPFQQALQVALQKSVLALKQP